MSSRARTHASLTLGLVVLIAAALWLASRQIAVAGETPLMAGENSVTDAGPRKPESTRAVVFPVPGDFKVKLIRAGLDARALCAAGVTSNLILTALQAAADNMNGAPTSLDSADASYASSRNSADALARKIQSGNASQEEIASYPAARTALASAESAQQSVLDGFFNAAVANLPNAQRIALANIRANKGWELPVEYCVMSRTETEWVALRDALANERIAVDLPGTLSPSCQALLTTVRAHPAVSAARSNIQNGLSLLTNAWNTAVGD